MLLGLGRGFRAATTSERLWLLPLVRVMRPGVIVETPAAPKSARESVSSGMRSGACVE